MASSNPRYANYSARVAVRNRVRSMGLPCAICGKPIDYTLRTPDPWSYELDEIVPVSKGGSPIDICNVQPVHRACNLKKGNRVWGVVRKDDGTTSQPDPDRCSREW